MSNRTIARIILAVLLAVFLVACLTVHVHVYNGGYLFTDTGDYLLGIVVVDVLAMVGILLGGLAAILALGGLVVVALSKDDL